MIIDMLTIEVTTLKGHTVECVSTYKYPGTVIDKKLNFEANCEGVRKKGHHAAPEKTVHF